jgi:hypothetical protein
MEELRKSRNERHFTAYALWGMQLKISGQSIRGVLSIGMSVEDIEVTGTAAEVIARQTERVNRDVREILQNSDLQVMPILSGEEIGEEIGEAIRKFNMTTAFMMEQYSKRGRAKEVEMSVDAIKNILAAA